MNQHIISDEITKANYDFLTLELGIKIDKNKSVTTLISPLKEKYQEMKKSITKADKNLERIDYIKNDIIMNKANIPLSSYLKLKDFDFIQKMIYSFSGDISNKTGKCLFNVIRDLEGRIERNRDNNRENIIKIKEFLETFNKMKGVEK